MCTLPVHAPPMVGSWLLLHGCSEGLDRRQKHYLRGPLATFASPHPRSRIILVHGGLEGFQNIATKEKLKEATARVKVGQRGFHPWNRRPPQAPQGRSANKKPGTRLPFLSCSFQFGCVFLRTRVRCRKLCPNTFRTGSLRTTMLLTRH